jgi:hypothetical protein
MQLKAAKSGRAKSCFSKTFELTVIPPVFIIYIVTMRFLSVFVITIQTIVPMNT